MKSTTMDIENRRAIEVECRRLVVAFFHCVDDFDYGPVINMFVPDGVFFRGRDEFRGRDAILSVHEARARDRRTRHVCTNMLVDVIDGTHAEGRSYCMVFGYQGDVADDVGAPIDIPDALIEFHDKFVLADEGWKFAERRMVPVFRKG